MATKKEKGILPMGDRVLIKPEDKESGEKKSAAGIILPVSSGDGDKVDRGTVIAVGEGRIDNNGKLVPNKIKKGDKVLFQWGDKVKIDDEEYFIVSESSILAITQ